MLTKADFEYVQRWERLRHRVAVDFAHELMHMIIAVGIYAANHAGGHADDAH